MIMMYDDCTVSCFTYYIGSSYIGAAKEHVHYNFTIHTVKMLGLLQPHFIVGLSCIQCDSTIIQRMLVF